MATNDYIEKDLGIVTAYGEAVAGGYTGTRAEFQAILSRMANGFSEYSTKVFNGWKQFSAGTSSGDMSFSISMTGKTHVGVILLRFYIDSADAGDRCKVTTCYFDNGWLRVYFDFKQPLSEFSSVSMEATVLYVNNND